MDAAIEKINVSVYTIPTDSPESDGTYSWHATTLVLIEARAGSKTGLGYTYADMATASLAEGKLSEVVEGTNALDNQGAWVSMCQAIRNLGGPGISSMAISAIDNALWDLKARLLDLPLVKLLGQVATACRCTAAAASLRTRSKSCAINCEVGCKREFRESR